MLAQLRAIDSSLVLDDYFHPMTMDFVPSIKITEDGEYILKVVVTPDDDATVLSETDESGEKEYIISYVTNGQAREVDYSTFDGYYTDEDRYFGINIHIVAAPDGVTEGTLPEEEDT